MPANNGDRPTSQPDASAGDGVSVPAVEIAPQTSAGEAMAASSRARIDTDLPALAPSSAARPRANGVGAPATAGSEAPPADAWARFRAWGSTRRQRVTARRGESDTYSTIVVNRDDSLATICGKLDTARLPQVAVLIPHGNHELGRPLGVRRLMRHADLSGKDIVLVTRNLGIRQRAHAEGQPLASSMRRVRFQRLSGPLLQLGGLDLPLPGFSTLVALLTFAAFCVGAFIAVFWYLPVATVTLTPRSTQAVKAQQVTIDSQATRLNPTAFVVPAKRRQLDVTRTIYIPATGAVNVKQANGQPLPVPAVADKDMKFAQELATAAISEQGLSDLTARYGSMDTIFPETAQIQVVSVVPKQKAGDPGSFLTVTYRGTVSMLAASNDDLRQLFTSLLRAQVRSDQEFIGSSFKLSVLAAGPYDKGADKLLAQLQAQVAVTQDVDSVALARAIEGKTRRDATTYLDRQVAPVQRPEVKVTPGWAPWLPRTTKHIHVDLRAAGTP